MAVRIVARSGKLLASFALEGIPLADGYQVTSVDLEGDGREELVLLDLTGRVHAYDTKGRPVAGFPTPESELRVLAGPPLFRDIDGDGRYELIFLGAEQPLTGSKSMLAVLTADGRPLPGFPILLEPPASSPPVVVRRAAAEPFAVAFARQDGSIWLAGASGRIGRIGSVPPEHHGRLRLAAADVDVDGADEVLFVYGSATIGCMNIKGQECTGWPAMVSDATLTAIASVQAKDGAIALWAFDSAMQRLIYWSLAEKFPRFISLPQDPPKIPLHLATVEAPRGGGCLCVAMLATPEGETAIDPVFEREASPATKAEFQRFSVELRKSYPPFELLTPRQKMEIEMDLREYKRDLLVDQLGEEKTRRLLEIKAGTEIWIFDAEGRPLGGMPLYFPSRYPFLDRRERVPSFPAFLSDPSSGHMFLLIGMNGRAPDPGKIHLYSW